MATREKAIPWFEAWYLVHITPCLSPSSLGPINAKDTLGRPAQIRIWEGEDMLPTR
jgi:hypothetical protein